MGCFWRIILRDVLISVVTAIIVELVLDQYRKPKAQLRFMHDDHKTKKRAKHIEEDTSHVEESN